MTERILCVDDDPNVLQAYQRALRKVFRIDTAPGGPEGLDAIATSGPFAVIVSDMRMPGMDGVQFLSAVRERSPDSVRIMLTGNADQQTAIDAVNEGNIFRFLTKPCPPEALSRALTAALEQYRLVTAEKVLLEKTLAGAIRVLTDVLSLTNPTAFGHAARVRGIVQRIRRAMETDQGWQVEVAAMLSQIGCVTIPEETLAKVSRGGMLTVEERRMVNAHPGVGRSLVAKIPRLKDVAEMIAYQHKRFDGGGPPEDDPVAGHDIVLGARILKVALDFDALQSRGCNDAEAIVTLRERGGWYDPDVLLRLETAVGCEGLREVQEVPTRQLTPYMILAEDVKTRGGALLVTQGQEVTHALRQRLMNFASHGRIADCIRVRVRADRSDETDDAPTARATCGS